jgi:hypothetical protein
MAWVLVRGKTKRGAYINLYKEFQVQAHGKGGCDNLRDLNLEATKREGNPLPSKENLGNNQCQGCGKGPIGSPTGLSLLDWSRKQSYPTKFLLQKKRIRSAMRLK